MFRYIPTLADRPVPRYTSYPTAAEFRDDVTASDQRQALEGIAPDTPVSLYIHVPFCQSICWYCACNTHALGSGSREQAYVEGLLAEIATIARPMRGEVQSIHFGGGSPNALTPAELGRIMTEIWENFRIAASCETAMEQDPRTLTGDLIAALPELGVSRVSLGVQTFAPEVQARIGRIQPYADVARAVAQLREAGVKGFNFDLMFGLPGQTLDDIETTLDLALDLGPDRLAVFGYAHVPQMMPRQKMIDAAMLPDGRERFAQSSLAHLRLTTSGYRSIGFDHFARPDDTLAQAARAGTLRRNFQGYTDDPAGIVVGLGASAISQFDHVIVQNEKRPGHYAGIVGRGDLAGIRGVRRTAEDRLRADIIERLLCDGRVDTVALAGRHGFSQDTLADSLARLCSYQDAGLVSVHHGKVTLDDDAWPYARVVASVFDTFRAGACQPRFASARGV